MLLIRNITDPLKLTINRWSILLSFAPKPNTKTYLLYPLSGGFLTRYGRNLLWWLVVFLTLACLSVLELGISSIRKTFWPTDTEIFQELQNDKAIRQRFEDTVRAEEEGGGGDLDIAKDKKPSADEEREGEIRDLLDRPRVMMNTDADVVKSPVDVRESGDGLPNRSSIGHLTRRNLSTELQREDIELMSSNKRPMPKTRHSIDSAEMLGRRT